MPDSVYLIAEGLVRPGAWQRVAVSIEGCGLEEAAKDCPGIRAEKKPGGARQISLPDTAVERGLVGKDYLVREALLSCIGSAG
mgnify:CR=1 FL=1